MGVLPKASGMVDSSLPSPSFHIAGLADFIVRDTTGEKKGLRKCLQVCM
jgi:hypothetical protein